MRDAFIHARMHMSKKLCLAWWLLAAGAACAADPQLISVRKVWDAAPHNAFTDLIRWHDRWWLVFRESAGHVGGDGVIRVLSSDDAEAWESQATLAVKDVDLRDAKISITPDDRMMLVCGGAVYLGTRTRSGLASYTAFSADGKRWTPPGKVLDGGEWLWRVTWHHGVCYGGSYNHWAGAPVTNTYGPKTTLTLLTSKDGVDFKKLTMLEVEGRPGENTLRFLSDARVMGLFRRGGEGWIGVSQPPYTQWSYKPIGYQLGGPNFIQTPDGKLWAGSRLHQVKDKAGSKASSALFRMTADSLEPALILPSGGDCSYPGMVFHQGLLYYSYYSSHEGKTSIYLAKIKLPE